MTEQIFHVGVKALITDKKGNILLVKRTPGRKTYKRGAYWDIPGGRITSQGIEETLKRELREEIGVKNAKIFGLCYALVLPKVKIVTYRGPAALCLLVYNCKIPANTKIVLSNEHSEYKWTSMREAGKLLVYKFPKGFASKS